MCREKRKQADAREPLSPILPELSGEEVIVIVHRSINSIIIGIVRIRVVFVLPCRAILHHLGLLLDIRRGPLRQFIGSKRFLELRCTRPVSGDLLPLCEGRAEDIGVDAAVQSDLRRR